ncbi:MAG: hypothetical protein HZB29_11710 [Nitrospinae bacterium]|nr:hypothetical protein [Nitrospinota bacterium]
MAKAYFVYGLLVCGMMMYANSRGLSWVSALSTGRWTPSTPVHGMYHK